jgi:hypothetical protein
MSANAKNEIAVADDQAEEEEKQPPAFVRAWNQLPPWRTTRKVRRRCGFFQLRVSQSMRIDLTHEGC